MKMSARISEKWFPLAAFTIALSLYGAFQVQAATPSACVILQTQMGTLSTKELADAFEECRVDQELCEATIETMETTGSRGLTRSGTISRGALDPGTFAKAGFSCEQGKGRRADREKFLNKLQKYLAALQRMPIEKIVSKLKSMDEDTVAFTSTVCGLSWLRLTASEDERVKCLIVFDYVNPPEPGPELNACAMLVAYVRIKRPMSEILEFVEDCNNHPNKAVCEAGREIVQEKIDIKKLGLTCKNGN